jgi:hypothetical protein
VGFGVRPGKNWVREGEGALVLARFGVRAEKAGYARGRARWCSRGWCGGDSQHNDKIK